MKEVQSVELYILESKVRSVLLVLGGIVGYKMNELYRPLSENKLNPNV